MLTTKKVEEILYKYRIDFSRDSRHTDFGIREEDFHALAIEIVNLVDELPIDPNVEGFEMPSEEVKEHLVPLFNDFLNEHSENSIKRSQKTQNDLIDEIYKYFYEVFDEHDKNRKENPWLDDVYKQLSPAIIEGDDVGLLLRSWVLEENEKISDELARILRILLDAKKKLKK
jgi:hypothetical protein